MTLDQLIQKILQPEFLQELHRLLWTEPFDNNGTWDDGWNCRDHALVIGALAQMLKFKASIIFGKAGYIQGPVNSSPPVGLMQSPHAWVAVEKGGFFDLSLRLDRMHDDKWSSWTTMAVGGSNVYPAGSARFVMVKTPVEYENCVANATHMTNTRTAIYLGNEYALLSREIVSNSLGWCNSPLCDRVRAKFGEVIDFHARVILHLADLVHNAAEPMSHLNQTQAWEKLCERKGDQVYRVCSRGAIL